MKKNDLLDAMGRIDPALIEEAKPMQKKKSRTIPRIAGGLAAAVLLAVLSPVISGIGRNVPGSGRYLPNPWEQEDFRVVTVGHCAPTEVEGEVQRYHSFAAYGAPFTDETKSVTEAVNDAPAETDEETASDTGSGNNTSREPGAEVVSVTVPLDASIRIESLIADRYLLYENGAQTVIFDLETGTNMNLTERVLGNDLTKTEYFENDLLKHLTQIGWMPDEYILTGYPSEFRNFVRLVLNAATEGKTLEEYDRFSTYGIISDFTEIRKTPYYNYSKMTDAELRDELERTILNLREEMIYEMEVGSYYPAWIEVYATDTVHGTVVFKIMSSKGGGWYYRYDLKTDSYSQMPEDSRHSLTWKPDIFDKPECVFSPDGRYLTVSYTRGGMGSILKHDPEHPGTVTFQLRHVGFLGDAVGIYDLETGNAWSFGGIKMTYDDDSYTAASTVGRLSPTGTTVYYRAYLDGEKVFRIDPETFQNHRGYYPHEGDEWFFSLLNDPMADEGRGIRLAGNFVRFAKNDTVVIMEKDGEYRAYDLMNGGKDITGKVRSGRIKLMAHEYYALTVTDGVLTRTHLFNGSAPEVILSGDAICVSEDGGFAFSFSAKKGIATCLNTATLESYETAVSPDFATELASAGEVSFSFHYSGDENVLFLSFFREGEDHKENGIDFFGIIKNPDFNARPVPLFPYIQPDGTYVTLTEDEKKALTEDTAK